MFLKTKKMFGDKTLKEIKKITREFFEKAGFEVKIESEKKEDGKITVRITTEDPKTLIGQGGETLMEIQKLIKSMARRKIEDNFYLDLDINEYKEKKEDYLKESARSLADEVALSQEEKAMLPMSSYERRVIHLELADRSDVITESKGEGRERRVVVKPR